MPCAVLWVTLEIICVSFRPAKSLSRAPKCVSLGCKFVWAGNSEELESLGLSAARDFADAALYAPHFFVDAFITVMPTALF